MQCVIKAISADVPFIFPVSVRAAQMATVQQVVESSFGGIVTTVFQWLQPQLLPVLVDRLLSHILVSYV